MHERPRIIGTNTELIAYDDFVVRFECLSPGFRIEIDENEYKDHYAQNRIVYHLMFVQDKGFDCIEFKIVFEIKAVNGLH